MSLLAHTKSKLVAVKLLLYTLQIPWFRKLHNTGYTTPFCTTFVVTGLGWLLYEVYATYNTLKTIGKISIVTRKCKYIHIDEKLSQGLVLDGQGYLSPMLGKRSLKGWLQRTRYRMAARLLTLAQGPDTGHRRAAVRRLATLQKLSEADLRQLAQACDAATAVGLARTPKSNPGLFLPPPTATGEEELVQEMKELLYNLNLESGHSCIKYFISKVFPDNDDEPKYFMDGELMMTEPWLTITSDNHVLPMCIQALEHHVVISKSEKLLVNLGGLTTLMSVFQIFKDNVDVIKSIINILATISSHKGFLPQLNESGWIGVLASLLNSKDEQVSLLAGQCLVNLDMDDPCQARYGEHVVLLHPIHRAHTPTVDVVFVHGLLGGIFTTWRQRHIDDSYLFPLTTKEDSAADRLRRSSDAHTQAYLSTLSELTRQEWDQLGSDFEFVADDFPLSCKPNCTSRPLTFSGKDPRVRRHIHNTSYTMCWPKDWLPIDCPSIRVLGIKYESRLSEWFPSCSEKSRVKSLQERSTIVLDQLRRSDIGQRPIVWVAHSMGGLLVKRILSDATRSAHFQDGLIASNTKAVVFLSTPHLGCPLAKLNEFLNYLLWPSKEVEELQLHSEILNDLQVEFYNFLKAQNVKIVTFTEAKSTKITSLGGDLHVVPPEFSYFAIGELYEMPCDHASVAKPNSRLSFIYDTVLNTIKSVNYENINSTLLK